MSDHDPPPSPSFSSCRRSYTPPLLQQRRQAFLMGRKDSKDIDGDREQKEERELEQEQEQEQEQKEQEEQEEQEQDQEQEHEQKDQEQEQEQTSKPTLFQSKKQRHLTSLSSPTSSLQKSPTSSWKESGVRREEGEEGEGEGLFSKKDRSFEIGLGGYLGGEGRKREEERRKVVTPQPRRVSGGQRRKV